MNRGGRNILLLVMTFALVWTAWTVGLSETKGTYTDQQYVLYVGTNDKDTNQPVFTQTEAMEKLRGILVDHFGGYTIQEAHGGWQAEGTLYQEYTLVVYLSDTTLEQVHAAADEIIETFRQSSILIQTNPTTTEFYSGAAEKTEAAELPLSEYWTPDSAVAASLRDYVTLVTDPEKPETFIPVEDRIAVFDMDGTLTCETYYTYYDTMMFIEYCLKDHPERVSDELRQAAAEIRPGYLADESLARNFAKAFAGMTVEEFSQYAVEFGKKETASFVNMRYIDNFYLPMVELVKYLYDHQFTIYVISGTERTTTRAIVANSPIRDFVTPNHVIGTDFEVKVKGYETESSNLNFKYVNGDELVLTGGFIQKNLNGNKAIYIEREIGQRPVLAFGNSGSDTRMMNYTIDSRNPYPAQAYMVVADDSVREWGKQDWAQKSADYETKGYIPVSMANDFAQIYEDGIMPATEQYQEPVPYETPGEEDLQNAA